MRHSNDYYQLQACRQFVETKDYQPAVLDPLFQIIIVTGLILGYVLVSLVNHLK